MIRINKLIRVINKALEEFNKPETFVKGDEFEDFVRDHLFTDNLYKLIEKNHDYSSNKDDYIESSKSPDFKLRLHGSDTEFYLEAKYHSYFYKDGVEWCTLPQLSRYKAIARITPVLVAIGVGGKPKSPEHILVMSLRDIKWPHIYRSRLNEHKVQPGRCIDRDHLAKLLQAEKLSPDT